MHTVCAAAINTASIGAIINVRLSKFAYVLYSLSWESISHVKETDQVEEQLCLEPIVIWNSELSFSKIHRTDVKD